MFRTIKKLYKRIYFYFTSFCIWTNYFKNAMRVWLYFESLMIVYDKKKKIKLLFFLICSHKLYNYFEGDLFSKTNSKKFPSICIRVPEVIKDWFLHEHTDKDTYSHTYKSIIVGKRECSYDDGDDAWMSRKYDPQLFNFLYANQGC